MNRIPADAVIFDLDGTLMDTASDLIVALDSALRGYGGGVRDRELARKWIGHGARNLVQKGAAACGVSFDDKLLGRFIEIYRNNLAVETRLYPDLCEVLESLAGVPLAVWTNKPHDFAVELLERFSIASYFSVAVGPRAGIARKPSLDGWNLIRAQFPKLRNFIMVGDGVADAAASRAAEIPFVWAAYGYSDEAAVAGHGFEARIASISELPARLAL